MIGTLLAGFQKAKETHFKGKEQLCRFISHPSFICGQLGSVDYYSGGVVEIEYRMSAKCVCSLGA